MRFTNTTFKTLAGVSALFACGGANAQTKIVDTIGNGNGYGIGLTRSSAAAIGYDPLTQVIAPNTPQTAGYAVLPFTISNAASVQSLSEVDIVLNIQPSSGTTSNLPSLSGAIVVAPASNSLSLTGLTSANFFSFNTSPNTTGVRGDGLTHLYSATGLGAYNLTKNNTYWLVIAPKAGLAAQAGDTLLDFGALNEVAATGVSSVASSNALLSNGFATVGQGLFERQGANAGDTLSAATLGRGAGQPAYFGARIIGTAVPEPSSLLAMAGGIVMAGGLIIRRRR